MVKLYMMKNNSFALWMVSPNRYVEVSFGESWFESTFSANYLSKDNRFELVGKL